MGKVSVVIPARNEPFLQNTVSDLLKNARGDIEIIVILDGYWPNPPLSDDSRLILLHRGTAMGMRAAINAASGIAKGDFLMKSDAHCMYAEGFDVALQECEDNWIVVPRRKRLDPDMWAVLSTRKPDIDYEYLSCPMTDPKQFSMHGVPWDERAKSRSTPEYDIDENMSFQGSCWFMPTRWYRDVLGGMDERQYGSFWQEAQEIGLKTWLGGGAVMVNKKTWYAHWHKPSSVGRGYHLPKDQFDVKVATANYWMNNEWPWGTHDIEWLIDRFWPVPTWPEGWKELPRHG